MKKKIIIFVSVILLASALITGWVFLKMSKNPDKNGIAPDSSDTRTEFIAEDGTQMLLYPQGKTNENLILTECTVPYGAIYKNKHLRTIYVPWEKPEHFVKDGYFGHARYHWIRDFDFPYEIYYVSADGLSYEK